jgi:hypothetical protein
MGDVRITWAEQTMEHEGTGVTTRKVHYGTTQWHRREAPVRHDTVTIEVPPIEIPLYRPGP